MDIKKLLQEMTLEEKALLLTGAGNFTTKEFEEHGIPSMTCADGPHGLRIKLQDDKYTAFPNLCCVGASWDVDVMRKMGEALARECKSAGVSMLLAPGANIKRHILCGRNFEYISEDPVLTGEMAAAYINGLQNGGVAACLKHLAMNNQEAYRSEISVEADMRTIMEIYLKGFEIAVKKSDPVSIMCAYNKLYSIWCSENRFLLTEVLREKWGYEGFVVSDWGAVHNICRAVAAGLDLQMPSNKNIVAQIKQGLEDGVLTVQDIDRAVTRVLTFAARGPVSVTPCDREEQHKAAEEIAASGIVLLKNNGILPLTKEKNKKIAIVGEYAQAPLVYGQGSSQVHSTGKYIDSPLEEIKKLVGDDIEIVYTELYKKTEVPLTAPWGNVNELYSLTKDCDTVVFFMGAMLAEDTEMFDRKSAQLNPYFEMYINRILRCGKRVVVVLQSGSAMILGSWHKKVDAIVQMWLGGEGAGKAIADVLTGAVNPSGKLSETFPSVMPRHLNYPGDGVRIHYSEGTDVGYRYYDRYPEEVCFPFGHGLSYTTFDYSDMKLDVSKDRISVSATVRNTGDAYGGEVVQLYVSKKGGTVDCPIKELKAFKKVFLQAGESTAIQLELEMHDIAYYNTILSDWVVESSDYEFMLAASSADIRLSEKVYINADMPYTVGVECNSMIVD